jgi:cell division transport system permease protein
LKISLKGAAAGSALAAAVFLVAGFWQSSTVATPQSDQASALFGSFSVGLGGYLGIALTMIIIALLTTITARMTVIRTIDDIDRVRSDPSKSDGLAS